MAVTIRLATEADGRELARLRWDFSLREQRVQDQVGFARDFEAWLEGARASADWTVAVAESNGTLVGCMFLCSVKRVPVPGDAHRSWGYLTNSYVDPEHRGGGVGKRLLDLLIAQGRARGHGFLIVWPSGAAVSFYSRAGFEPVTAVHIEPDNPPPMELILLRPNRGEADESVDNARSDRPSIRLPETAVFGTEEIRIVPTSEEFADRINAAFDQVARERKYLASTVAPSAESTRVFIKGLTEGNGVQAVALAGDRVVGWADVVRERHEGFGHVGRFAIVLVSDYRGKGLGERLTKEVLRMASEAGMTRIELQVFATNARAIALYRKLGFATEGVRRQVRKVDGLVEDELLMALFVGEERA